MYLLHWLIQYAYIDSINLTLKFNFCQFSFSLCQNQSLQPFCTPNILANEVFKALFIYLVL